MDQLIQDLRYGVRTFIRQPVFALTAILALALGIGANTAVFSVVYAVLLKPLPYPDPEALVFVHDTYPAVFSAAISAAKFVALREGNQTLVAVGATAPGNVTLTGRGEPEQVTGARVSAELFKVLDVPAQYGRWFSAEEDAPNAEPVIVLSYALWQRRFGSDPRIVGTPIQVDGQSRMVVGVMPPGFSYPGQTLAWVPLGIPRTVAPAGNFLRLLGRMRKGVTVELVQRDLARVSDAYNEQNGLQRDVKVWPLHEIMVTNNRRALLVLQGAVAFVLLVACANVANLLLARSVGRHRELAIRTAVGAGGGRIFRQLLTESVLLSVAGGTIGVLLASWLLRLFLAVAPTNFPRAQGISLDTGVLVFTVVLAVLTGVLFGVAPARRGFRTDPIDSLRDTGTRGATAGSARGASRALVVAEVALALVLVVGAGLMVKSLLNLERQDAGFHRGGLITFELALPPARYPASAAAPVVQRIVDEIRGVPGVQSAGGINYLPIANFGFNGGFAIEGRPPFPQNATPVVEFRMVTPGYFATMGIPFERGQDFSQADTAAGRPVVIINQAMATRYWPNANPIGARVQLGVDTGTVWREIVGVVGNVRSQTIGALPVPETFVPHTQVPVNSMGIAVRVGELDPARVLPAIRQRIAAIDNALPLVRVRSMDAIVEGSAGSTRMQSVLTSVFALVAALLAAVGVYSLIAYSVAQRTRELGIRVALGADRLAVLRLILGEGVTLAAVGIVIGLGGAVLLTRTLASLLYEVSPTDPGVLAITCAGLLGVATVASLLPAIRALRVDPMTALRQ
jgi:putative ABC transport system permease protein